MSDKAKKAWCVYADELVDSTGRSYAPGDGITAGTRRLYGLADTEGQAQAILDKLEGGRLLQRARIPGDNELYPVLSVGRYDPLDFVGRQHRDEYTGKRYAALCGDLAERAKKNAADIL